MTPHSGEVVYEGIIGATTAGYARFGRALIEHDVKLINSFRSSSLSTMIQVKAKPKNAEAFAEAAKVHMFRYRAGEVFDNGTLRPMYASPEDEIAGRKTEAALRILAAQDAE